MVPPGEDPAERAEPRSLAPTVVQAPAPDGAHALYEPADQSEQQVEPDKAPHQAFHDAPSTTRRVMVQTAALAGRTDSPALAITPGSIRSARLLRQPPQGERCCTRCGL